MKIYVFAEFLSQLLHIIELLVLIYIQQTVL
jgi:hypothetical protein